MPNHPNESVVDQFEVSDAILGVKWSKNSCFEASKQVSLRFHLAANGWVYVDTTNP